MRTTESTEYVLTSRRSTMTIHVRITPAGTGLVSGWIRGDWPRSNRVESYLATLPARLWDRADVDRFTFAFDAGALSRKTALDLDSILSADLRPKRSPRAAGARPPTSKR